MCVVFVYFLAKARKTLSILRYFHICDRSSYIRIYILHILTNPHIFLLCFYFWIYWSILLLLSRQNDFHHISALYRFAVCRNIHKTVTSDSAGELTVLLFSRQGYASSVITATEETACFAWFGKAGGSYGLYTRIMIFRTSQKTCF